MKTIITNLQNRIKKAADFMATYRKAQTGIASGELFSGKEKARQLRELKEKNEPKIIKLLESIWADFRSADNRISTEIDKAKGEKNAGIDFAQLSYEVNRLPGLFSDTRGPGDIDALVQGILQSGDSHQIRALLDNGPAIIRAQARGSAFEMEANTIAARLSSRARELFTTPAVAEAEAISGDVFDLAKNAYELTLSTGKAFDYRIGGFFQAQNANPFVKMLNSVVFEESTVMSDLGPVPVGSVSFLSELPRGVTPIEDYGNLGRRPIPEGGTINRGLSEIQPPGDGVLSSD